MKAQTKTAVALCVCAALTTTAGAVVRDQATDESPFAMQKLTSGYMIPSSQEGQDSEGACGAADHKDDTEGSCGEGSCGANEKDEAEGSCGEGSCGANNKDEAEGACGEGSCGADNKDHGDNKEDAEGACGEGSCGGRI